MHVFITGGTRGIGNGLVREFLKSGIKVSFTGTSEESVRKASVALDGSFFGLVCDVRSYDSILNSSIRAIEKFGNIDVWINNAGIDQPRKTVDHIDESDIRNLIDINVTGSIHGTKVAISHFKENNCGIVYNMEGLGSNGMKIPETIIYGSSKSLITYFSEAANKELKKHKDIFVGRLQPGMVFTDLLLNGLDDEATKIASILGNKVETVTPYLVKGVLKNKRVVKWLTTRRIMFKFIKSIFVKTRIEM